MVLIEIVTIKITLSIMFLIAIITTTQHINTHFQARNKSPSRIITNGDLINMPL